MSDKYLRDDKQQLINAIGTELAWGWSPAVNFAELLARQRLLSGEHRRLDKCEGQPRQFADAQVKPDKPEPTKHHTDPHSNDDVTIDAMIAAIRNKGSTSKTGTGTENESINCSIKDVDSNESAVRILLCGACDIRHIFRTLSSLRLATKEGPTPTYHFFLYEPNLRIHCRHLFFLQWLLDSMFSLDELEERVLMFLDAFGNSVTRDVTAAQCRSVSQRVLRVLRKEDGELAHLVSFTEMKSKERDFVEEQIAYWTRDTSQAKVAESWSKRLRQEMAERYDNRDNIIDWDFNFHLHDYTNLLKFTEYRTWRNTGIAFDTTHINPRRGFLYDYTVPNKTLCHFNNRGDGFFAGDVKNGPFYAFGSQTANQHIRMRTVDGSCKYGNGVVSMHNVRAWLYSLLTGLEWPWGDHAFAWDEASNYNFLPPGTPSDVAHQAVFPKVHFHFIGLDFQRFGQRMRAREGLVFDAAFVGTGCTQFMTPDFFQTLMKPNGVVVAETAKFVLDARDESKMAFADKIRDLAKEAGWEVNDTLTARLHEDLPEPPLADGGAAKAKQITRERYLMPHQLAITRHFTDGM